MKLHLPILLLLLFMSSFSNNDQAAKELIKKLTLKIDSIITNNNFNGVVLITKDSSILYKKAIGYSDLENKILIKENDQFVIGSISKQITAVLILKEYEKGTIQLSDKISKFLPEINQSWTTKITIHHLLTHTHGIIDINKPLEFEEGSQFHYSQIGYELLAQIVEKITKKSFDKLSTELFTEFGLSNTFHPDNKNYKNLVKGYEEKENGALEYTTKSLDNYAAAGSFISNVEDLNKWNQLLYSGRLVKKETLALMKTRYATRIHPIFEKVEYGYGLLFKDGEENIQIGAFGYVPGFVSACYYYPHSNINLIVLENTARNINDFKSTFKVHTELMDLIKNEGAELAK
ncbi:MAG: serine hydrolase domain-containing protein [Bacteroidia bacterium]